MPEVPGEAYKQRHKDAGCAERSDPCEGAIELPEVMDICEMVQDDLEQQQEAIMILANNGDIHLKAANGKIKLEALDIELIANGNAPQGVIWANAYETLKLDSKNVTIDGKQSCKVMTSGLMTIRGGLGTQMLSPLIEGVSAAMSKLKLPEPAEINKE